MSDIDSPAFNDIIAIVANLVPDLPEPSKLFAEILDEDRMLWLEGWCDGCIADQGFPPKGEGMLQQKLDHLRNVTLEFLETRAEKRGMEVRWYGFLPLDNKKFLYGVSWGIFHKKAS